MLVDSQHAPYARSGFLRRGISASVRELVKAFDIKTPTLDTPARNLSGGNIQKLIVARELSRRPGVLVAQPTAASTSQRPSTSMVASSSSAEEGRGAIISEASTRRWRSPIGSWSCTGLDHRHGRSADDQREEIGLLMAGVRHDTGPSREASPQP